MKWVERANLHLTLKFLGEIDEKQQVAIRDQLLATAKKQKPFEIQLEGIGAFPKTSDPRVIWIGVTVGKEPLMQLARTLEEDCAELGFAKEERPFSAHLTIGRVRSSQHLASLVKKLQVAEFRGSNPASIEKLILFQSLLLPAGPTYIPLAETPFI